MRTSPLMSVQKYLEVEAFLELSAKRVILDVRSPLEYDAGHIPGAVSFPLFTNSERAKVGTTYKQKGRDEAIKTGLEFVGPKLRHFVEKAQEISNGNKCLIHCWRGGMRSSSMAWLLSTSGMQIGVLNGGYKAYRNFALTHLALRKKLFVLSGFTGSGKTEILEELRRTGENVVDLEGLAHHKGSAFGSINQPSQPSTEMFQNILFTEIWKINKEEFIWVEDEAQMVGTVAIPREFYVNITNGNLIWIKQDLQQRIQRLVKDYGDTDVEELKKRFVQITKRIGSLAVSEALAYLDEKNLAAAAEIALHYYDKAYLHSHKKRKIKPVIEINGVGKTNHEIAEELKRWKQKKYD